MKHYDSIQDFLTAHGWAIDNTKEPYFHKDGIRINCSEISKHSLLTFIEKARQKGWITEEEELPIFGMWI